MPISVQCHTPKYISADYFRNASLSQLSALMQRLEAIGNSSETLQVGDSRIIEITSGESPAIASKAKHSIQEANAAFLFLGLGHNSVTQEETAVAINTEVQGRPEMEDCSLPAASRVSLFAGASTVLGVNNLHDVELNVLLQGLAQGWQETAILRLSSNGWLSADSAPDAVTDKQEQKRAAQFFIGGARTTVTVYGARNAVKKILSQKDTDILTSAKVVSHEFEWFGPGGRVNLT